MDKDTWIAQQIFPKNENINSNITRKPRLGVTTVNIAASSRKTKVTLCILGSWAIYMPPYNLARLSSIIRESGFKTFVYDFNVESHYLLKEANPNLDDAWNGANYWWWEKAEYYKRIHPTYKPILDSYVETLLADDPDILGFSIYYTNILATKYVIEQVKNKKPNIIIVVGGPEAHEKSFKLPVEADYQFIGESEQNFLDFLINWENGVKPDNKFIGSLYSDTRIDIDSLPYPDYSDFDLTKYWGKNSICAEISRGCVAKCTYCTEVYYWKFRDRGHQTVVDELEYQVKKYGITFVSFVDSLMNGNLKEFKRFCEELVKRDLKINWWGYARADGRMDLEYYTLMAKAGCQGFNYGIETGSDKVLKAINKKNTIAEINQNIIDSDKVGMKFSACWVIGAPGEDIEAFNHSFNLIWNHRKRLFAVSPGPGLGDNFGSAYDDREKFNINERSDPWLGGWWTKDLTNTKLHRHTRIKLMHIWLEICKEFDGTLSNVHRIGDQIIDHYNLKFDNNYIKDEVLYENFDYNIIKSGFGTFADSVMNEVFGLFRLLWRVKGGFEMSIHFNKEIDHRDFIFTIVPDTHSYEAEYWFKINDAGEFEYKVRAKFENFYKDKVKIDGFNVAIEDKGTWNDIVPTKTKKLLWIKQSDSTTPINSLPIQNCFADMSVDARRILYKTAKNLGEGAVIVESGAKLGGTTSILAAANPYTKILSIENFVEEKISPIVVSINKWVENQLNDWCVEHGKPVKIAREFTDKFKELINEDPTGKKFWEFLTSKFQNITPLNSIDDTVMNIDLYFHNSGIYEPHFNDSIDFWEPKIKSGGFIIIHPYYDESSDFVKPKINQLLSKQWKIVLTQEHVIVLQKLS